MAGEDHNLCISSSISQSSTSGHSWRQHITVQIFPLRKPHPRREPQRWQEGKLKAPSKMPLCLEEHPRDVGCLQSSSVGDQLILHWATN